MKQLTLALLIAVLGPCSLYGQKSSAPSSKDTALKIQLLQTQLLAQVDVFMDAWKKQDAAALTATMAPEFLYASPMGVASREGVVGVLTHVCKLASYSLGDVRVLPLAADAAALVYHLHQSATCGGHPDAPEVINTDTLVHRDGKWLFIMTTSTPAR